MQVYSRRPDQSGQQWFAEMASPYSWLVTADNLFEQCVRLHAQKGSALISFDNGMTRRLTWDVVDRSMFLLGGFALENAIKAFLVYENPSLICDGRLAKTLASHKLVELKQLSRTIPMPKKSEPIIAVFEAGIQTWSRYPCGRNVSDTEDQRWFTPELWSAYCDLMRRYGRKLERLLESGWKGPHDTGGTWSFNGMNSLDVDYVTI